MIFWKLSNMKKTLWVLLDNRQGSIGQAKGIIAALGDRMTVVEKKCVYNMWGGLSNWLRGRSLLGVDKSLSDALSEPYPDAILSISRRTVPVARYIRKKSGNKSKIIQLMYPSGGVGIRDMEMVIVPQHDREKNRNNPKAYVVVGAPSQITTQKLAQIKTHWQEVFKDLPHPWIAVIVGGSIKGKEWPLDNVKNLAQGLANLQKSLGGSVLLTTSRRTGKAAEDIILESLKDIPHYAYVWGDTAENPLQGFYACADKIVATADSVSMCSEACATSAPVLLFKGQGWLPAKQQRFAQSLVDEGYATYIDSPNATSFVSSKILNPAQEIADKILERV
jgi:hypothetical protein